MLTKFLPLHRFIFLFLPPLILLCSCAQNISTVFTKEEQEWLKKSEKNLEVLFGYEAPPNAYHDSDGNYRGLLVDFLTEIEKTVGISFTYRNFSKWNDLIEYSKSHNNFIVVGIAETRERAKYLSFTDPFIKVPYIIVSQRSSSIGYMEDLTERSICTVANYAINDYLEENYPTLSISPVADNLEGLRGVSTGIYDAMILNQMYASYIIEEQGLTNLKIAGESGYLNRLSAANSIQDPTLSHILEKAVDQINPRTKRQLYQKWLGQNSDRMSSTLLTSLLGFILCTTTLLAIFWGWNISLKKTVRKRTLDIIRSRENYKTTIMSIGDGIITTDAKGLITGLNPVAERLTGCSEDDGVGKPLSSIFNIVDTDNGAPLQNPAELVISSGNIVNRPHHPTLISATDEKYIIDESAAPIKNGTGEVYGVVLAFRDITERYKTQMELLKNEQQLSQYIAQAPIGVAILNLEQEFTRVNRKMCDFSGFIEEELLQKQLTHLLPKDYHQELQQAFEYARRYGSSNLSPQFTHKTGTDLFCSIHIGYVTEDSYLIFFNDISQQKLAEEELLKVNKLRSIGTLAGGIAHDFNNILMGIFGNIEISRELLDPQNESREFLDRAAQSLGRATRLTQQLLTFSKCGEPIRENTQLLTLIREAVNFDLAGSNISTEVHADPELWLANVDKGQIGQVLSNLFINGKQAMPDGGTLKVNLSNTEIDIRSPLPLESGPYIKLSVADTGTGIAKEHLPRVFDPYFTTKQSGSGLGLTSTYSIIIKHKGHIGVMSEPGEGTVFTLFLPAVRTTEQPRAAETDRTEALLEGSRILVMDDNQEILDVVHRILAKSGAKATTCESGEDAIASYRQALEKNTPYSAVILDLTVPGGMGGKETAQEILKLNEKARLIVSSGYGEDPILANHEEYGFTDVLSKPYTKIDFLGVVGRVVAQQSE